MQHTALHRAARQDRDIERAIAIGRKLHHRGRERRNPQRRREGRGVHRDHRRVVRHDVPDMVVPAGIGEREDRTGHDAHAGKWLARPRRASRWRWRRGTRCRRRRPAAATGYWRNPPRLALDCRPPSRSHTASPQAGCPAPPVTVVYERTPGRSMPTRSWNITLFPRNQSPPVSARSQFVIGSPTNADALNGPDAGQVLEAAARREATEESAQRRLRQHDRVEAQEGLRLPRATRRRSPAGPAPREVRARWPAGTKRQAGRSAGHP